MAPDTTRIDSISDSELKNMLKSAIMKLPNLERDDLTKSYTATPAEDVLDSLKKKFVLAAISLTEEQQIKFWKELKRNGIIKT